MRPRPIALPVIVALTLGLGLSACGDKTLSKDEYIKQADAICKKFQAKSKELPEPESIADIGKLADKAKPQFEDQISQLRALKAPDDIKEGANQAYDLLDQQVDKLDELKAAAAKNDEKKLTAVADGAGKLSSKANAKAKEIGLKVCGSGA